MDEACGCGPGFGTRRRWRALLTLGAAAVLAHLVALSGLGWAWPQAEPAPGAARPVRVRALSESSVRPDDAPRAEVHAPARPAPQDTPAVPDRPPHVVRALQSAARPKPRDAATPADTTTATTAAPVEPVEVAAASADEEPALPSYRTVVPPAVDLHFEVRRGAAVGSADLQWRVDAAGAGYELSLLTRMEGAIALVQSSEGGFDAAGVAPLRFVDRRATRAAAAANFQRDAGRITFSRKAAAALLRPGSQDRLSWMLQLPAIVGAETALRESGAGVLMNVASAGGDVAVWVFRCQGRESLPTDAGAVDTLRYVREPRGPYDTRVEVWLDARGPHLPVRMEWKSGPADDGFALRRLEAPAGP